ncbi:hypothetical protein [Paraburkholderia saeva]|uniref:hypothetical protein n=1 Tax=Paraburkholderia saeva TaxID=2777537 RepID=UPI001E2EA448|nr:hypothetical protein [Paraburkholderia saeva]
MSCTAPLARLTGFGERSLLRGDGNPRVADALHGMIVRDPGMPDAPRVTKRNEDAGDVPAITQGTTDGTGERGKLNAAALRRRVMRAVLGYCAGTSPRALTTPPSRPH